MLSDDVSIVDVKSIPGKMFSNAIVLVKTCSRRVEEVLKTSSAYYFLFCKTSSWRRLEGNALQTRLVDVFKLFWRRLAKTFGKMKHCYAEDIFKTYWKTRNVSWARCYKIISKYTSLWFMLWHTTVKKHLKYLKVLITPYLRPHWSISLNFSVSLLTHGGDCF